MVAGAYCAVSKKAMRQQTLDYYTYILKSLIKDWYYIGHTSNLDKRLSEHNTGRNKSTKPYKPYKIVHLEHFKSKSEAYKREQQIKRYRHGEAFKRLI